jgi:hypothetical protein
MKKRPSKAEPWMMAAEDIDRRRSSGDATVPPIHRSGDENAHDEHQQQPIFEGDIGGQGKEIGFPANPRATMSYPVFFLPRWSAGFHMVTDVSFLVIPRG